MNNILFFAYDGTRGTTFHFVDWILAIECNKNKDEKIQYVISHKEQNEGLLNKLKENIPDFDTKFFFIEDLDMEMFSNIDILHVHGLKQLGIIKKNNIKAKVVFTVHAYRNSKWYKYFFKMIFSFYLKNVQKIHFVSNFSRKDFFFLNPFRTKLENRSFVAYLGIDKNEFETIDNYRQEIKDNYLVDYSNEKKNIIYLAQFHGGKGHEWLIHSISKLKNTNVVVWLFGDGPLRNDMIELVNELKLSEMIKFPGQIDRKYVPWLLNNSYFALVTSRNETFGHNYIEPFGSNIPVVGTAVGIGETFLQDYYTGLRVNWGDTKRLSYYIDYLLDNENLVSTMGNNSKRLIDVFFTWNAISTNCLNIYRELKNETNN